MKTQRSNRTAITILLCLSSTMVQLTYTHQTGCSKAKTVDSLSIVLKASLSKK